MITARPVKGAKLLVRGVYTARWSRWLAVLWPVWAFGQAPENENVRGNFLPYQMALLVRNADTTQAWYSRCFGFRALDSIDVPESRLRIRVLERNGFRIELLENATTVHPDSALRLVPQYNGFYGYYKLSFQTDDLDALDTHLRALGTQFFFSLRKEEEGANEFLIVYDPDGNLVQVVGQ